MRNRAGAMTIWLMSAATAGPALAQPAGPEQAQQQVAQIQMRLQKNPDLKNNAIDRSRQQWGCDADGNGR